MKDRELKLIPTVVFFACLIAIFGHYLDRSGDLAPLPIQQIVEGSDSKIYALYYTDLIGLDDGNQHSFQLPDIQNHVGQIVAHPDGGWIINKGAQGFFVFKAVKRIFSGYSALTERVSTLMKCDSQILNCEPWGEAELQFKRAFEGIATENNQFLLFAPNKKKVYLTDADGVILDTVKSKEYWYGTFKSDSNKFISRSTRAEEIDQLSIQDNKIVIDENIIDLTVINGGEIQLERISKVFFYNNQYWMAAKQYIGSEIADANLDKDIKEDSEKEFISNPDKPRSLVSINKKLELNDTGIELSNVADIELINDSFYFTTYDKDEIKRFDLNQEKLDIVSSNILQTALEKADKNREVQKQSLNKQMGILSIPAILSFIWLLMSSKPTTSSYKERTGLFRHNKKVLYLHETPPPDLIYSSDRVDIPFKREKREKLKKITLYVFFALYLVYVVYVLSFTFSLEKEKLLKLLSIKGFIFLIVVSPFYYYFLSKLFFPKKLFVEDGFLYWEKSPQKTYQFEPESLVYSRLSFADRHIIVLPNFGQQSVYDEKIFVNHVLPIIKQGRYLNNLQFAFHYIKHQFADIMIHVFFFGGFFYCLK